MLEESFLLPLMALTVLLKFNLFAPYSVFGVFYAVSGEGQLVDI